MTTDEISLLSVSIRAIRGQKLGQENLTCSQRIWAFDDSRDEARFCVFCAFSRRKIFPRYAVIQQNSNAVFSRDGLGESGCAASSDPSQSGPRNTRKDTKTNAFRVFGVFRGRLQAGHFEQPIVFCTRIAEHRFRISF